MVWRVSDDIIYDVMHYLFSFTGFVNLHFAVIEKKFFLNVKIVVA